MFPLKGSAHALYIISSTMKKTLEEKDLALWLDLWFAGGMGFVVR